MILADRLSQFPSRKDYTPIKLHQNMHYLAFTLEKINIIRGAVKQNPILSTVYCLTLNGWPDRINEVPWIARQF